MSRREGGLRFFPRGRRSTCVRTRPDVVEAVGHPSCRVKITNDFVFRRVLAAVPACCTGLVTVPSRWSLLCDTSVDYDRGGREEERATPIGWWFVR